MKQTIGQYAILLIVILVVIAVVYFAAGAIGVPIPGWVIHLFWVVIAGLIAIGIIRLFTGAGGPPSIA